MELTDKMQLEIVQSVSTEIIELVLRRMNNLFDDNHVKAKFSVNILVNAIGNMLLLMKKSDGNPLENFTAAWNEIEKIFESWHRSAIDHIQSGSDSTMKIIDAKTGVCRNVE